MTEGGIEGGSGRKRRGREGRREEWRRKGEREGGRVRREGEKEGEGEGDGGRGGGEIEVMTEGGSANIALFTRESIGDLLGSEIGIPNLDFRALQMVTCK